MISACLEYKSNQFLRTENKRALGTRPRAQSIGFKGKPYFLASASILSFNACSWAFASPMVGADSSADAAIFFLADLTLRSSCSLNIAVWLATTLLKSLLNSMILKSTSSPLVNFLPSSFLHMTGRDESDDVIVKGNRGPFVNDFGNRCFVNGFLQRIRSSTYPMDSRSSACGPNSIFCHQHPIPILPLPKYHLRLRILMGV